MPINRKKSKAHNKVTKCHTMLVQDSFLGSLLGVVLTGRPMHNLGALGISSQYIYVILTYSDVF